MRGNKVNNYKVKYVVNRFEISIKIIKICLICYTRGVDVK